MRSLAAALGLVLVFFQSGCSSIAVWNFKKASVSGAEKGKVALVFLGVTPGQQNSQVPDAIAKEIQRDTDFSVAAKPCLPSGQQVLATSATGVIVAAIAQAGFNIWADAQQRRVQDIVDSAQQSYSQTEAIDPNDLQKAQCVLLLRYVEPKEGDPQLGAVALLRLESAGPAPPQAAQTRIVRILPLYVRLNTAVAVTKEAPQPTASVSLAISIKAVARDGTRLNRLLPAGEGSTTIPDVVIDKTVAGRCGDGTCKRSDLIPFPTDRGMLSITVSATEQGKTGFNDKAALAELAAIKEALGPAIAEAVKARYED